LRGFRRNRWSPDDCSERHGRSFVEGRSTWRELQGNRVPLQTLLVLPALSGRPDG
jgi:hypothetical protein